ncbi:MAG TPA: helix-turn-helix domain-containing protein [Chitinophagaceae bacterium]|nr:helix-turn-helix domain-containing protein [Chitinophagaceae bacterium]
MDPWNFLLIINIGFIAIIFLIHFNFTKKDIAANRMFSLFLFCLGYTSFTLLLFSTKWILNVPHFARTGSLVLYLIYPSAYLYTRKILKQESWKRTDLLHLIPAILYIIDFIPYFLWDADQKRTKLLADFAKDNIYIIKESWLFPSDFHFIFRSLLSMFYVILVSKLWVDTFYKEESLEFRTENRSLMQWTFILTLLLLIGIMPSLIVYLFNIELNLANLTNSSIYFITICFALFLFFRPEIIYGVKGIWVPDVPSVSKSKSDTPLAEQKAEVDELVSVDKKIYLKENIVEKIGEKIESYLAEEQAYLKSGFSISDLSFAIGHPVHQISAYLNNHVGMNFNEYTNRHRINYLLKKLKENKDWQRFTLEALGQQAGFSNRYTFLNAFKKVTGETPSAFLKNMKSNPT